MESVGCRALSVVGGVGDSEPDVVRAREDMHEPEAPSEGYELEHACVALPLLPSVIALSLDDGVDGDPGVRVVVSAAVVVMVDRGMGGDDRVDRAVPWVRETRRRSSCEIRFQFFQIGVDPCGRETWHRR